MSWNGALGGDCSKPKRAAAFSELIEIFPLAALSLLHCRDIDLNFPYRVICTVLQRVPRGPVQTLEGALGLEKGIQAGRGGMGRKTLYFHSLHTPGI